MWIFKDKNNAELYNKRIMASIIGIHADTLRKVINGKQSCSKIIAYSITKFLNNDAEIEDYFIKKGE